MSRSEVYIEFVGIRVVQERYGTVVRIQGLPNLRALLLSNTFYSLRSTKQLADQTKNGESHMFNSDQRQKFQLGSGFKLPHARHVS
jgi:hypothetical protein